MFDPARFYPLRHRILVAVSRIVPSVAWFPGFVEPPPNYHPLELPAFVRKRLIEFLECRYPVPPKYLRNILTTEEAGDARRLYRELRIDGVSAGEAILQLGLVDREKGYNLPNVALARVLRSGCSCIEGPGNASGLTTVPVVTSVTKESSNAPTFLYITSSAGEPLSTPDDLRVIRCTDAHGLAVADRIGSQRSDVARLAAFRSRSARYAHAV